MTNNDADSRTVGCLLHAINDAQLVVRAYDLKAEIMALLVTTSFAIFQFVEVESSGTVISVFKYSSSLLLLVGVLFLIAVIYPVLNPWKNIKLGDFVPSGVYFINADDSPDYTVPALVAKVRAVDWVAELTYELMKITDIRDRKQNHFRWAIRAIFFSLILLVPVLIFRSA